MTKRAMEEKDHELSVALDELQLSLPREVRRLTVSSVAAPTKCQLSTHLNVT